MIVYADTSFFASLYLRDTHLAAARSYLAAHRDAVAFTGLQRYELRNAIRLAVFRRLVTVSAARNALTEIDRDVSAGNLDETPLVWTDVLQAAEQVGEKHTARLGVRALDLLHVAAAVTLGAKAFLTFAGRQHALAKAAGLRVGPD
jgi:hypothetical protein